MSFDREFFDFGRLDGLSYKDSPIHRIDPRAKIIILGVFIATVVSFPKYELTGLVPFFLYPALIISLSDAPVWFIIKKAFIVSPFAVFAGIFNPLIDKTPHEVFLGITISGGWISFISIMMKFFLTITAGLLLIATTSFPNICRGLRGLYVPEIFVQQLMFLYRYIFVLSEEAMRMVRARELRSFDGRGKGVRPFISLAGVLFLRTVQRAERVYYAMLSRGFDGSIMTLSEPSFRAKETLFVVLSVALLLSMRLFDLPELVGRTVMGR